MPMTNWRHQISLTDIRKGYETEQLTLSEFCVSVADRIMASPWAAENDNVEGVTHELRWVTSFDGSTEADVDDLLQQLYDLADDDGVWLDAHFERNQPMTDPDKPIIFDFKEAQPLAALIVEYHPDDTGWKVLAEHLANAYLISESTHQYRAGYDPKRKSKYDRAEDWAAFNAVAEIVAAWPTGAFLAKTSRPRNVGDVSSKLAMLRRGETSRQIELDAEAAEARQRADLSARANEAVRELERLDSEIARIKEQK